ncbi:unnamed protein product, partial [Ectocarpus sp. 12 AP-2014]
FLPRLRELAGVARAVLVLEEPPESGGDVDTMGGDDGLQSAGPPSESRRLELRFPQKNTAGTGKAKVSKRLQLVRQAILDHAEGRTRRLPDGGSDGGTCAGAGSGGGGGGGGGNCGAAAAATDATRGASTDTAAVTALGCDQGSRGPNNGSGSGAAAVTAGGAETAATA